MPLSGSWFWPKALPVLAFALLGFAVMGYHPGVEDDGVYLTAVKADVQPDLYPHDAEFFKLQMQATVFDRCVTDFVEVTRIPVVWAELLWQFLTLYLILWAAQSIAARLFAEPCAQWAGVALLAAMFTLPVAGTALFIADQHLHPRGVATALILLAVARILAGRAWQAVGLLIGALVMHPIMAVLGITFCAFLGFFWTGRVPQLWWRGQQSRSQGIFGSWMAAAVVPLGWVFEQPSASWREALETRTYYFIYRWAWYEWLGAIGPLVLFALLAAWARRRGDTPLAGLALAVTVYGVFGQVSAMMMLANPALIRLTPLQPMRYLHLVYVFMALVGGCLLGKHLLKARVWRWATFLVGVNTVMFACQRAEFAHSPHLELPDSGLGGGENAWVQAFNWVRLNTPRNAYFALDPYYLESPGEDFHSFRALAERSQLADAVKDAAVVTQVPRLGPEWKRQVEATLGWSRFELRDFERLKTEFGVDWVLADYPGPTGLKCLWHNDVVVICRIP